MSKKNSQPFLTSPVLGRNDLKVAAEHTNSSHVNLLCWWKSIDSLFVWNGIKKKKNDLRGGFPGSLSSFSTLTHNLVHFKGKFN